MATSPQMMLTQCSCKECSTLKVENLMDSHPYYVLYHINILSSLLLNVQKGILYNSKCSHHNENNCNTTGYLCYLRTKLNLFLKHCLRAHWEAPPICFLTCSNTIKYLARCFLCCSTVHVHCGALINSRNSQTSTLLK